MPAKTLHRIDAEGTHSHIYNRGNEKRIIFKDKEDYEVFLGYLKGYLTPPSDPESAKRDFTVNGRLFRGIPHQPKNYFDKVELVAYNLAPNHFHLLLYQKTRGSLERFTRSLCTRYSMYFNKKYNRSGALFEGPYKSVHLKDEPRLLLLTRYMHQTPGYSSYKEYLGERDTSWVKPKKGTGNYRDFVEKHKLNQKEIEALGGIILERPSQHLEGREPILAGSKFSEESLQNPNLKPQARIPELAGAVALFLLLLGLGVRNIKAHAINPPASSPPPQVSGVEDVKPETKKIARIKITDGAKSVNVRLEPTTNSTKIGEIKDGDTFEVISKEGNWYYLKLSDNSTGFVSARYVMEEEK